MTASAFRSFLVITLAAGTVAGSDFAQACGESLFRVGRGVAYREYSAPVPGHILVVARSDDELAMVERLAAAGHDMQVVANPGELRAALEKRDFDIVMSLYADHASTESQLAATRSTAVYLPVAMAHTNQQTAARALNRFAPATNDNVKTFLRAIHRTLKAAARH